MIRFVQSGTPRQAGEGVRIGTVRRPPRGVPRAEFSKGNWYDVWLPELSPSPALVTAARTARNQREWMSFVRKFSSEMKAPASAHALDLLAVLSHQTHFSVCCYCPDERRCHRSILRTLLAARGAVLAP